MKTPVLGLYQPGTGWLFRLGAGWKYLVVLALTIPPLVVREWWFTVAVVGLTFLLLVSSKLQPRRVLNVGWLLWTVLVMLAVYHVIAMKFDAAIIHPGNILNAVLAARMLTLTTPVPVLIDALVRVLRPLPGINAEKVAMALALMIRSIPYLIGSIDDARDAVKARGVTNNPLGLLTPVMLNAVAYAERTGEAMAARGIPDR